jgi:hypothetical protein
MKNNNSFLKEFDKIAILNTGLKCKDKKICMWLIIDSLIYLFYKNSLVQLITQYCCVLIIYSSTVFGFLYTAGAFQFKSSQDSLNFFQNSKEFSSFPFFFILSLHQHKKQNIFCCLLKKLSEKQEGWSATSKSWLAK